MWTSSNAPVPVPPALTRQGQISLDDPAAWSVFDAFHQWAQMVGSGAHRDEAHLGVDYFTLQATHPEDVVSAPRVNLEVSECCWVDPSRYDVSDALLRDFFSRERNWVGELGARTVALCARWSALAARLTDADGAFSPPHARSVLHDEGIEMVLDSTTKFMHAGSLGGRHRTVAMLLLGAPALPARVYAVDAAVVTE